MKHKLIVFIGRFQPYHIGHKAVVDRALELAENVLILVGSSYRSPSFRNPWSFEERSDMIFQTHKEGNLTICPLEDHLYNDTAWIKEVQDIVSVHTNRLDISDEDVCLIGCNKDSSSYYLKLFPFWKSESVEFVNPLNGTDIRKMLFEREQPVHELSGNVLPHPVAKMDLTAKFREEYQFLVKHSQMWKDAPYPPTFQTVDAVVEQSGHILLIERKLAPGKGLMALPGGYVNASSETLLEAVIRELKEETKLKVPVPVLKGSIENVRTFDDPYRSDRGRIFTQAYHFRLNDFTYLPQVKGSDDAKEAFWMPISEVAENRAEFFEDHYFIIKRMLGI